MKKLLGIIVLIVLPVVAFSQDKIDSLQREISSRSGIEKFEPMVELSRAWWYMDSVKMAVPAMQEALELALSYGDTARIIQASWRVGIMLNDANMYEEAEGILEFAIPLARRRELASEVSAMRNSLAMAYGYQAKYDEGLKLHFENLQAARDRVESRQVSMSLNNIGLIYYKLKDYEKALVYFRETVAVTSNNEKFDLDVTLLNIALCHISTQQYDSARLWTAKGLQACEGACSKMRMREAEYILGLADFEQKNIHSAETHFLQSYSIAKEIGDVRFQFDNIYHLSKIYIERKEFDRAAVYLKEAEQIIDEGVSLNLEVIKIYKRFSELYTSVNNYKMAAHYQRKYIELKDSVYNEELTTSLMKTEAEHMERENKVRIKAQQEVLLLNEEIINRQKIANVSLGVAGLMAVFVAVVLYRSNRQKNKINLILDERVKSRTRELEEKQVKLLKAARGREHTVNKAVSEMRALMSSIIGLCHLTEQGQLDVSVYVKEVQIVSDKIKRELNAIDYETCEEQQNPHPIVNGA